MDPPRHVFYFALRPPPVVASAASRLAPVRKATAKMPAERLHVSLTPLGRFATFPDALIEAAVRAADGVRAAAFRVAFNRLATWGRGPGVRPVVLSGDEGVIGAEWLHEAIHARLAAAGLAPRDPCPLWPHMTLARDGRETPQTFIEPLGWPVREFVLIESLFGLGRQETLGRWTLGG